MFRHSAVSSKQKAFRRRGERADDAGSRLNQRDQSTDSDATSNTNNSNRQMKCESQRSTRRPIESRLDECPEHQCCQYQIIHALILCECDGDRRQFLPAIEQLPTGSGIRQERFEHKCSNVKNHNVNACDDRQPKADFHSDARLRLTHLSLRLSQCCSGFFLFFILVKCSCARSP